MGVTQLPRHLGHALAFLPLECMRVLAVHAQRLFTQGFSGSLFFEDASTLKGFVLGHLFADIAVVIYTATILAGFADTDSAGRHSTP